jgi:uncharacterized membrane protein YkoI
MFHLVSTPPQSRHVYLMQRDERSSLHPLESETTMNFVKLCLAGSTAAALIVGTLPASAYTGEELANQAKISITEARTIALKAHPGTITDE